MDLIHQFTTLTQRIRQAEQRFGRSTGSVSLVAVSKTHSPLLIAKLVAQNQQAFGENYLQEALKKISALNQKQLIWHFLGPIQSNKAQLIAQNFSWVHTVCRTTEAERLAFFRPPNTLPLNICIQVKLDSSHTKSGVIIEELPSLVSKIQSLPHLRLRGLMGLPPFVEDFEQQRHYFKILKELFVQLNQTGASLDTLSMGMSHDFEAAIAEGATIIRIGTALFGPRSQ